MLFFVRLKKIQKVVSYIAYSNDCLDFMEYNIPNMENSYNWFILPDSFIEVYLVRRLSFTKVYLCKVFKATFIIAAIFVLPEYAYK